VTLTRSPGSTRWSHLTSNASSSRPSSPLVTTRLAISGSTTTDAPPGLGRSSIVGRDMAATQACSSSGVSAPERKRLANSSVSGMVLRNACTTPLPLMSTGLLVALVSVTYS
jgi:hypothetical protein